MYNIRVYIFVYWTFKLTYRNYNIRYDTSLVLRIVLIIGDIACAPIVETVSSNHFRSHGHYYLQSLTRFKPTSGVRTIAQSLSICIAH